MPHRVTEHDVDELPVREHVRAYMREAFTLAADPANIDRRFGPCAHQLGRRGHCLTKAAATGRRSSGREDRKRHVHAQLLARSSDPAQRALAGATERIGSFRYVGQGHLTAGDALLAAAAAARAREHRRLAREERAMDDQPVPASGREVQR